MAEVKKIDDRVKLYIDKSFDYQRVLTSKLDNFIGDFDQERINEIVLWKVNRYASLEETGVLDLINRIKPCSGELDEQLTREILNILLSDKVRGVRLPIASTILRFRNPNIYQIIDQRVFRYINGDEVEYPSDVDKQISFYLDYLKRLRDVCDEFGIAFKVADRVLYEADKDINKDVALKNYGKRKNDKV